MYKILIDYIYGRVEPKLPTEIAYKVLNGTRYHPDGYDKTWKYKNKQWDGYEYLFDLLEQTFRTGLSWRVEHILKESGLSVEVHDLRRDSTKIPWIAGIGFKNIEPYFYQNDAAFATQDATHGIVASPTGTGKTIIMALIAKRHATRTLIVVNSRVLLDQTFEFFDSIAPGRVGIVGSGDFELQDITVAMIQSLGSILGLVGKKPPGPNAGPLADWLSSVGLVIHDEVHDADSSTVNALYRSLKASRFVGMTATPYAWARSVEKGANLEMEQHFGRKVYDSRDHANFIELGITVPLYISRVPGPVTPEYAGITSGMGLEYIDVIAKQIVDNDERTEFIAKQAATLVRDKMSCYVFYNRIAYGEKLCAAMSDLDPVMIQGATPRAERNKVFADLESKKRLLVVSDIGSYGLNIKSLDSIVLAFPSRDARQLKGRVCRAAKNKKFGMVVDVVDEAPFLKNHSELRFNQYKKDKDRIIG